jgi:hypothetical protein
MPLRREEFYCSPCSSGILEFKIEPFSSLFLLKALVLSICSRRIPAFFYRKNLQDLSASSIGNTSNVRMLLLSFQPFRSLLNLSLAFTVQQVSILLFAFTLPASVLSQA